ncbi:MAG: bifunctional diaminohydroxyphosphoribosylaminopyrimidine deaminase/5-amino-6-(5-phosphoribosylamino)uracil reductase RibD [Deltaproteobacteria bacterium]|nr:bifunctional diaminohydroxyphosphoribosylaminopyrimidine deaminase/5-amino-6-(5-phosphoribosylamino)uracil reductase RibD [Deltaproteobacteria bacterium]
MERALELAARGRGGTSPNPMVGAILVKDGVALGEGWHRRAGEPHAEPNALAAAAGHDVRGATAYVTLEPCCHEGGGKRTPPCTRALIEAGVARVVIGALDPNPRVSGRGVEALRAAGVVVETGVLAERAARLNVVFEHWIRTGRPYVRLKLAQSLDGRIAPRPGIEHAVTGPEARARVHRLRADSDAVIVGRRTAEVDDPRLTVRGVEGDWLPPLRVVLDAQLGVGPEALVYGPEAGGAAVVTTLGPEDPRARALAARGVEVLTVPAGRRDEARDGERVGVDPAAALAALAARPWPVTSVLIEGGGRVAASFLAAGLVDALVLHVAPAVFGAAGVPGFGPLDGPRRLCLQSTEALGDDLELVYVPRSAPHEGA